MKKKIIISIFFFSIAMQLCILFTSVNAAKISENSKVVWDGEFAYAIVSKDEVWIVAVDNKYAEKKRYFTDKKTNKSTAGSTLIIPAKAKNNGKTYRVTGIIDGKCASYSDEPNLISGLYYFIQPICFKGLGSKSESDYSYFGELNGLEKLVIPNTIKHIGTGAFSVHHLKKVVFKGKFKDLIIGKYAFAACSEIESLKLPEGTIEIGLGAVSHVKKLTIPSTVKKIGAYNVTSSVQSVKVASGNKYFKIKDGILYSKDESILYGASARSKKNVIISKKTTTMCQCAFSGSKIKSIQFNDKLKKIPSGAFERCTALTELKGTDNITEIGYASFYYCPRLKKLGTMSHLKIINRAAFWESDSVDFVPNENVKVDKYGFEIDENAY